MEIDKIMTFLCPTKLIMGINAHKQLKEIIAHFKVDHLFFLADHGVASTETYQIIEDILQENHVPFDLFTDIEPDPSDKTVEKAYNVYKTGKAPVLLALGGGSTMDVGKAVAILATNGGRIHDYEGFDKFSIPPLPLIAVPTTAGTGSEVSAVCSITDTVRNLKMSIRSAPLNPAKVAILDPIVLRTLPMIAAIHAGMDAFIHALESYLSLQANAITDAGNICAIELISHNIRPFVADRDNLDAGLKMLCAASMGAMGFSNTGAGNVHCMARFVSAFFHIPHGLATAVCLPYAAEFNLMASPEKFARVALAMGENTQGLTTEDAACKALQAIKRLCKDLHIPETLSNLGVTKEKIPEMARLAYEANYNRWNPRYTTEDDFLALFKKAF
ncbi:MAG: iron-containing alcohol dehydrogenase [Pseudomonadota bacterium]